jgi:hypothetical protein
VARDNKRPLLTGEDRYSGGSLRPEDISSKQRTSHQRGGGAGTDPTRRSTWCRSASGFPYEKWLSVHKAHHRKLRRFELRSGVGPQPVRGEGQAIRRASYVTRASSTDCAAATARREPIISSTSPTSMDAYVQKGTCRGSPTPPSGRRKRHLVRQRREHRLTALVDPLGRVTPRFQS